MLQWLDQLKPADWILAVYTVTTMAAAFFAYWTIRHNRRMTAASWLFTAHRNFHGDDKLYTVFDQLKNGRYHFNCYANKGKLDLGTEREHELVNFLDFLNSVEAALDRRVIYDRDLFNTTIGFALEEVRRSQPIFEYIEFIDEQDAKRQLLASRAWGFLRRRGSVRIRRLGRSRVRY